MFQFIYPSSQSQSLHFTTTTPPSTAAFQSTEYANSSTIQVIHQSHLVEKGPIQISKERIRVVVLNIESKSPSR
jgi:hypothetical protein